MKEIIRFKFIHIKKGDLDNLYGGKPRYYIYNNRSGDMLATLYWYAPWRQWCVQFDLNTIWSASCLADVNAAIAEISKLEKASAASVTSAAKGKGQ